LPKSIKSIQEYYQHHISSIKGNLKRRGDDFIAGTEAQELIDYYYSLYKLPNITLLDHGKPQVISDKPSSSDNNIASVPVTIRFNVENERRIIDALRLKIDKKKGHKSNIQYDENGFFVRTQIPLQNAQQIVDEYEELISKLVVRKNLEIKKSNKMFREKISNIINQRKKTLKTKEEMIGKLSKIIPIVKKTQSTSPIVPLTRKKQIVINPPRSKISADPKIDPKILESIMDVLIKGGHTFESTPETFVKLDEYDLRNILISFLNGNFEVRAVAEAFNKLGKSDISLSYSGNNLFIAECKFWGGMDKYSGTIDQLFRYLSWRENVGVLIIFVREKNFTSIIRKAKKSASSHNSFINNSIKEKSKSYFITRNVFPDDEEKTVEIHHLLFTLYSPQ